MYLIFTYIIIFAFWALYRYYTNYSIFIDEVLAKPVLWVGPAIIASIIKRLNFKLLEIKRIAFKSIVLSIIAGIGLVLLQLIPIHLKNPASLNLPSNLLVLMISLVFTAFSEEILFRGFFYKQFQKFYPAILSNILVSFLFFIIHLPVLIFDQNIVSAGLLSSFPSLFVSSFTFGFLYSYTKSLWSPIVAHFIMDFFLFFS